MIPALLDFLAARLAHYEVVSHPEAYTAQEEAAAAHVSGWAWAKVVLWKKPDGWVMAVLPAACRVDLGRLKGLAGEDRLELASVEEIAVACPGVEPGAVPPFGQLFGIPTLVDRSLLDRPAVIVPAGNHRTALRLRTMEYVRLAEPRIGSFAVHEGAPAGREGEGRPSHRA
jgi:Ala-tRNA(Pro) deacylase